MITHHCYCYMNPNVVKCAIPIGDYEWFPLKLIGDKYFMVAVKPTFKGYFALEGNDWVNSRLKQFLNQKFMAFLENSDVDTSAIHGMSILTQGQYNMYVHDRLPSCGEYLLQTPAPNRENYILAVQPDGTLKPVAITAQKNIRPCFFIEAEYLEEISEGKIITVEQFYANQQTENAEPSVTDAALAAKAAEDARRQEELEAKQREEEARLEEQRRLEAEKAAQKAAEEARIAAEEARRLAELEALRIAQEAEAKRLAEQAAKEAEERRLAEEAERQRLAAELEAKRLEEERAAREAAEAEARRIEEERVRQEEARKLAEEAEARRIAEEERIREEARLAAEAESRRLEEVERQRIEAERKAAEEAEQRRLAEEAERQRQAELEAQRLAEEKAAKEAAEAEARRVAEENARLAAEEEEKQRIAAELEEQRITEEEAARKAQTEAIVVDEVDTEEPQDIASVEYLDHGKKIETDTSGKHAVYVYDDEFKDYAFIVSDEDIKLQAAIERMGVAIRAYMSSSTNEKREPMKKGNVKDHISRLQNRWRGQ